MRLAGLRLALAVLLAGLLALLGRHLSPALRILLHALALFGRHLAPTLRIPLDALALLGRQPLEALVRRLELALPVLRQRLPAVEVLYDASPVAR
jgi:hypothetical protein